MTIKEYWPLAKSLPPHIVLQKGFLLIARTLKSAVNDQLDLRRSSFVKAPITDSTKLNQFFNMISSKQIEHQANDISYLVNKYCSHEFNLLGSGWVNVCYETNCRGLDGAHYNHKLTVNTDAEGQWLRELVNTSNLKTSQAYWRLIDSTYTPIDWQLDFKSGFRWSSKTRSTSIAYGLDAGVDIKVPWELARMQHLPQLAWAFSLGDETTTLALSKKEYQREFRNQILDFIACNPPRWGVNWVCSMDVAIRISSWLSAYDLFLSFGAKFDQDFENAFRNSINDHALHIINNLEWTADLRSNHYLSNIAGLIFVAAYLPENTESNAWLVFGAEQLLFEMETQFQEDGSNFEGSTNYHRLSAEIVIYSLALLTNIPQPRIENIKPWNRTSLGHRGPGPLPPQQNYQKAQLFNLDPNQFKKLRRIASFTRTVNQEDGSVVQIGDNDSGRFLKLQPLTDLEENFLNHQHLLASFAGFLNEKYPATINSKHYIEEDVFRALSPISKEDTQPAEPIQNPDKFEDFGLYILKNEFISVAIRCGSIGQNGNGGHAHNDQLSFTTCFMGETFFVDPGTYLYTPHPDSRNHFRSTTMHNTLSFKGAEQNQWLPGRMGLFSLSKVATTEVSRHGDGQFCGKVMTTKGYHQRSIFLEKQIVKGVDEFSQDNAVFRVHLAPDVEVKDKDSKSTVHLTKNNVQIKIEFINANWSSERYFYSPSYGDKEESIVLNFTNFESPANWLIEIEASDD